MRGKGRQGDVKSWLEVTVYLRAGEREQIAVAGKRWRRKDLSCLGVPVFVRGKV